jgi:hypothetical protein
MEVIVLMAVMGLVSAAFYMQSKTAIRAKNNTMRLLAEVMAEKQQMLNDIRVLVRTVHFTTKEQAEYIDVHSKWHVKLFHHAPKEEIRISINGKDLGRVIQKSTTL